MMKRVKWLTGNGLMVNLFFQINQIVAIINIIIKRKILFWVKGRIFKIPRTKTA